MIKTITEEQVNNLYEMLEELKGTLQDYSITLQQHGLNEQNSRVIQQTSEIEGAKRMLYALQDRPPVNVNVTKEDLGMWKMFGYVEASYFHTFGTKIKINNFTEYENATFEIGKYIQEQLDN